MAHYGNNAEYRITDLDLTKTPESSFIVFDS
jgi:hypothetical protein